MTAKNDITGDSIQTRGTTEEYRNNYELIWGKKDKKKTEEKEEVRIKVTLPEVKIKAKVD